MKILYFLLFITVTGGRVQRDELDDPQNVEESNGDVVPDLESPPAQLSPADDESQIPAEISQSEETENPDESETVDGHEESDNLLDGDSQSDELNHEYKAEMVTDRNDDYIDMSTTASTDISSSETSIQPTDATQSNSDISVSVSTTRTPVTTDNQDQTISPYMNSPRPGPTTAPATSTTVSTSSASTTKEPISTTPDMIPSTKPDYAYEEEQRQDEENSKDNIQTDLIGGPNIIPIEENVQGKTTGVFIMFIIAATMVFLFIRWRRNRRNDPSRQYISAPPTFNNPVSFPDMNYHDDPL